MAKLTDTKLMILAAAANRDDGSLLPLPRTSKLDPETADGVVNDLLKKKLAAERPAVGPGSDPARKRCRSAHHPDHHPGRPARHRRRAGQTLDRR